MAKKTKVKYYPRIVDEVLATKMKVTGAVVVYGTKWCGKTTTCEQVASSCLYLNDPSLKVWAKSMADINLEKLIDGETPRLIDEWQMVPRLWDAIRFTVDRRRKKGQFVLTGSSTPLETKEIFHSGAGRYSWIRMRPMSLFESGDSTGEVSLRDLFDGENVIGNSKLSFDDVAYLTCRGGWPDSVNLDRESALMIPYEFVEATVNDDCLRKRTTEKTSSRMRAVMRSLSRNQGTQISLKEMVLDIGTEMAISDETVSSYISALRDNYVVEDVPAWNPNLRSKTAIRTSDTRYFVDPSIAVACLEIGPDDLSTDLNTFGLLFETLCMRDLRIYAESLGGKVYHYRDKRGLECDAVIHIRGGKYGLAEIKLGGNDAIDKAARKLIKLKESIDTKKTRAPSFMAVITAVGEFAYMRTDGVYLIPIGCLRN